MIRNSKKKARNSISVLLLQYVGSCPKLIRGFKEEEGRSRECRRAKGFTLFSSFKGGVVGSKEGSLDSLRKQEGSKGNLLSSVRDRIRKCRKDSFFEQEVSVCLYSHLDASQELKHLITFPVRERTSLALLEMEKQ